MGVRRNFSEGDTLEVEKFEIDGTGTNEGTD